MALFSTERSVVFRVANFHAGPLRAYHVANAQHLRRWEPRREDGYHSEAAWRARILEYEREQEAGNSLHLVALGRGTTQVLGVCNFTNIVRGEFQACHVGFSISEGRQGNGLMTEILRAALDHVFRGLELHRVMANYLPENHRSARLLEGLGFEKEGMARAYLKVGGCWRDHVLTSKLNPEDA